jgi:hypothetical protein
MKRVNTIACGMADSLASAFAGNTTSAITAGTTQTQAGATVATGDVTVATVGVANDGVILSRQLKRGDMIAIRNASANAGKLYPSKGGALNGGSADASIALAASKVHLIWMTSDLDAIVFTSA